MPKKRQKRRPEATSPKRISWGPSANPALTEAILPETQRTFERLVALSYAPEDVRRLSGAGSSGRGATPAPPAPHGAPHDARQFMVMDRWIELLDVDEIGRNRF